MKKVLLSSVAALAVFAAAAPVFANDGHVHTGSLDNKTEATGPGFFTDNEGGLTQEAKNGLNNVDAESTEAKFNENGEKLVPKKDANGNVIPGEFVVEGSAKEAKKEAKKEEGKAPAAAGQKTLPKTSAVK